jgi:amino acid transporter
MGLFSLVVYGVGDMVGSGIYVTIGRAAGEMGNAVWLAFVVSMVAALLTGLSYACLASRYPRAGGAAYVTHHAFRFSFLSYTVGLAVCASGLTSMATSSNAFAENLRKLTGFGPVLMWLLIFLGFMTALNLWGIRESLWANLVCTFIEVGALVLIIALGARYWGSVDYLETPRATATSTGLTPFTLFSGAVLTFFAFIGFEDMLNVAEECKEPRKNLPRGIVLALLVATVLYISVAVTAVSVVNYRALAKEPAPMAAVSGVIAPWMSPKVYTFITMFAVANTVLINYIMGSRLLYGMSRQRLLPSPLGKVHPTRHTPHVAILTLLVIVVALVLIAREDAISILAGATSLLLLTCFSIVNVALIVLKRRAGEPRGGFEVPIFVPALGVVINLLLIAARIGDVRKNWKSPAIAGGIIAVIGIIYMVMRPKGLTEEQLAAAESE